MFAKIPCFNKFILFSYCAFTVSTAWTPIAFLYVSVKVALTLLVTWFLILFKVWVSIASLLSFFKFSIEAFTPSVIVLLPLYASFIPFFNCSDPDFNSLAPFSIWLVPSLNLPNPVLIVLSCVGTAFNLSDKFSTIFELTVLSRFFSTVKTTVLIIWLDK